MNQDNLNDTTAHDSDALNRARSRIFNPELNNLIRKVTDKTGHSERETEALSGDDLLRRFHELFYRAKNITWYTPACPSGIEKVSREIMTNSEIDALLEDKGCRGFAVLCYDYQMKGFLPVIHTIAYSEQLCIGLHDPLLAKIGEAPNGLIVHDKQITETMDVPGKYGVYMLSGLKQTQRFPSEIFMTICEEDTDVSELAVFVRDKLSEALYAQGQLVFPDYVPFCGDKFERIVEKAEVFLRMALNNGASTFVIIGVLSENKSDDVITDSILMLPLVYARLREALRGKAFFLRLVSDCFFVMVKPDVETELREALYKSANSKEGHYYMEKFDFDEYSSFNHALLNLVML